MSDTRVLVGLWALWALSWMGAALWASRATRRPPLRDELVYRILTIIAAVLVYWSFSRRGDAAVLWTDGATIGWAMVVLAALGLGFTWWARLHLGRLWSGSVTRKADHRIVDTGPYGLVRHPIYTGLLLAVFATMVERGNGLAVLGAAAATLAFYVKARVEERFLSAELGQAAYADYRRRVPMLVPFWPTH